MDYSHFLCARYLRLNVRGIPSRMDIPRETVSEVSLLALCFLPGRLPCAAVTTLVFRGDSIFKFER